MAYLALIVEDVVINKWQLNEEVMIIGRAKDCDIQIDDQSVSSKHARILLEADPYFDDAQLAFIEDLMSTNGTIKNGRAVKREKLDDGDMLKIGFNQFRYVDSAGSSLDETAVIVSDL
jgi:pSer/pThr/pTyr-binding forkhead associated (FHA) protein